MISENNHLFGISDHKDPTIELPNMTLKKAEDDQATSVDGSGRLILSGQGKKRKVDEIESGNNEAVPPYVGKRTIFTS
jgi:hypothetical protein